MAEHPDIAIRLRQEVLDTVGPTDRPNYEHIKEMKYMRAFINGLSQFLAKSTLADCCFRGSPNVPACVSSSGQHCVDFADDPSQSIR